MNNEEMNRLLAQQSAAHAQGNRYGSGYGASWGLAGHLGAGNILGGKYTPQMAPPPSGYFSTSDRPVWKSRAPQSVREELQHEVNNWLEGV